MGFSISISGSPTNPDNTLGEEQSLLDDLVAAIKKHADKITFASGTLDESGQVDLLALAGGPVAPPSSGSPSDPTTGFVWRLVGETDYAQMEARLFAFNANAQQQGEPQVPQPYISHDDWLAINLPG